VPASLHKTCSSVFGVASEFVTSARMEESKSVHDDDDDEIAFIQSLGRHF
jgi:hypothetical protein